MLPMPASFAIVSMRRAVLIPPTPASLIFTKSTRGPAASRTAPSGVTRLSSTITATDFRAFRLPSSAICSNIGSGTTTGVRSVRETARLVTIRNGGEADQLEMLELLLRVFRRWPAFELSVAPLEHLRWKMRSDPAAARHHVVAESENGIIAMMLRILRRARVRGRDYLARDSVDAAVDPRYQGQGLYGAMLDHVHESPQDAECDLAFWYSTNPRTRRRSRPERAGKPLANPIQVLQRPCRARALVARRREKYGGRLPAALAVLRIKAETIINRLWHPPYWRSTKGAWSITTLERFDDRIGGFFDQAAEPFDFVVVRGKDYMNWRYCDPAAGRFTVRVAEQDERILGYLVFKVTEGGGYVADLLALPGRTDVVRSLVEDALGLLREASVELVTCWMVSRHPYNAILRRYGFIDSRRDVGFGYEPVGPDCADLEFLDDPRARIHLTHGDTDWI